MSDESLKTHSGFISIIGRPNVGKSTLFNALLGQKRSITTFRPQTTRDVILGVKTQDNAQWVFLDTPGLQYQSSGALNQHMNIAAWKSLQDIELILWVIEACVWTEAEDWILEKIKNRTQPVCLLLNKVDTITDKRRLLPFLESLQAKFPFKAFIPISAQEGIGLDNIWEQTRAFLPESPFYYESDEYIHRGPRFLASELLRETMMIRLQAELPYATAIEIENFEEDERLLRIHAVIWVEREGQKEIVIGAQGAKLKEMGTYARLAMEKSFGKKVYLNLWVKVKNSWSNDAKALKSLGYWHAD